MDLELLEEHYQVPSHYLLVETDLYRVLTDDQGVAIPVRSWNEEWEGFIILGSVEVAADALVHSSKGAIGRVVKRICNEILILGESIPIDWKTIPQDLRKSEHIQRATDLVNELHRKELHIHKHVGCDTWTNAHHLIIVPHSAFDKSLWIIGSSTNELVVIDGGEVLVREGNKLVYVSGPNGIVEITEGSKTVSVGGPGGITFNCKGEDVTLGTFLNNLFAEIGDSIRSRPRYRSRHF
ncbi:MAG: hypothetical protein ACFFB3_13590 [Candidatus Hodarchaeota archaeon]